MLLSAAYGMRRPSFRDLRLVEYTVSVRIAESLISIVLSLSIVGIYGSSK
jgi:hypothetical protein